MAEFGPTFLPSRHSSRDLVTGKPFNQALLGFAACCDSWSLIDLGLLREFRKLLPGLNAAVEALIRSNPAVQYDQLGGRSNAGLRKRYLSEYLSTRSFQDLLAKADRLILKQHANSPVMLRYLEALTADSLALDAAGLKRKLEALLANGARFFSGTPRVFYRFGFSSLSFSRELCGFSINQRK